MPGRYLRKKQDGPHDPTMTHVDDPSIYKVGDCIRDYEGWSMIVAIDEEAFPDTRFAHLSRHRIRQDLDEFLGSDPHLHDFRVFDVENYHLNAVSGETGQRPEWTIEEARE